MGRRVVSAAVGIPLITIVIWAGLPWMFTFVLILAAIGAIELCHLARGWGGRPLGKLSAFWASAFVLGGYLLTTEVSAEAVMVLVAAAFVMGILVWFFWRGRSGAGAKDLGLTAAAAAYTGILLAHAIVLRASPDGSEWVSLAVLSTFGADTLAFFVGTAIGKSPLAPSISPNKTWVGTIAGFICSMVFMIILFQYNFFDGLISTVDVIAFGIIAGGFGQLGDWVESLLKREAGLKDTGDFLRGHGGILDRFDSLTFAAPLTLIYCTYFIKVGQ